MSLEIFLPFILIYLVFLGALISPGPDLMITLRNTLGYSRRAGMFSAFGIGLGLVIHMAYCVGGLGILITQFPVMLEIIKYGGAAYLIYMGVQSLRSKGIAPNDIRRAAVAHNTKAAKSDRAAFINGFIANLLNPKATLFFLALFSQMIDPSAPLSLVIIFAVSCVLTAVIWFSFVAIVMGAQNVRTLYARGSVWIDRVFGVLFIVVGLSMAFYQL
jgi:RhtB (resistance to homoserine/threonine) family protein